jgi:hypothetical protein
MSTLITEPGLYEGISNPDYHADPVPAGSLSSTGARKLLERTPAHYQWERTHPVQKDVFDYGTAAHSLVLEDSTEGLAILDFPDYRTKAAQEAKREARENGLTPILVSEFAQVEQMAEQIRAHDVAKFLMRDGVPEVSGFWQHATGVWLRVRYDWLPNKRGPGLIIPDYKTAVSAAPRAFVKSCVDYGYHQQAAFYTDAAIALGLSPDPAFVFIVQEKTAPYLVNVIELDTEAIRLGRALNEKAIRLYQECTTTNTWPGYPLADPIALPKWAEYQIEDKINE